MRTSFLILLRKQGFEQLGPASEAEQSKSRSLKSAKAEVVGRMEEREFSERVALRGEAVRIGSPFEGLKRFGTKGTEKGAAEAAPEKTR